MLDGLGGIHGATLIPGGEPAPFLDLKKQKLTEGKDLIKYFCQPCTPTKSNGQRTRNLPEHAPDKWLAFKRYNIRDVETEMSIQSRLSKYPCRTASGRNTISTRKSTTAAWGWIWNWCGRPFRWTVAPAPELTQAMKELTSLDNPNSVQQMKQWLADNGMETDTLGKKAVADLLKTAPPELQKVLTLRQQLAKSSVKKYQAMETAVCADGRARGCSSFTEPTAPGGGQAASFRCRISPEPSGRSVRSQRACPDRRL